jgi:hypothetical protein
VTLYAQRVHVHTQQQNLKGTIFSIQISATGLHQEIPLKTKGMLNP